MKENMQGCYCPYCSAWNSITNRQCSVCGEDLPEVPMGSDDEPWHVVPDDPTDPVSTIIPDIPVVPDKPNLRTKFLVAAILAVCCILVVSAVGWLIYKITVTPPPSTPPTPTPVITPSPEITAEPTPGSSTPSETPTPTPDTKVDEHEYTAPALLLTSFGGETTGDELVIHTDVHDNYNNKYDSGLGGTRSSVENITEYLIGDQYKYFSFRVVLNYERRTDYHPDTYVRVYADGSQVYKSKIVRSGFKPEDVTLDVRGVEKLKIGICGWGDIRVVDPVLHNDEGYKQYSTMVPYSNKQDLDRVPLSYLEYWNGSSAEGGLRYITTTIRDESGNIYGTGYCGTHEDQDNWVEYDISDCGFKKLTGTIIMNAEPGGVDTVTPVVAVYEGAWLRELYKSEPVTKGTSIQHFEVSLKNAPQFRLQISGRYNIRLVDCYISK